MIRQLRAQNFKAWRDTKSVSLAPLTVLFGPNSSGKSSINHLLMLLRQTVRSPDRNSVLDMGDPDSPVQLGTFRDLIFDHATKRELQIELDWDLPAPLVVKDSYARKRAKQLRATGHGISFNGAIRQAPRGRTLQSQGFTYGLLNRDGATELVVRYEREPKRPDRWKIAAENYKLVRTPGRAWELPKPVQFYGFPNEATAYFQNSAFLGDLELAFEAMLESVHYLGPLRDPPKRLYFWTGTIPEEVGWRGEYAVQAILAGADRRFNWKPKAKTRSLEETVASWLSRLGLATSFEVSEIAPGRSEYEVRVQARRRSPTVQLTDVGFGVSQVLPVIAQMFYAAPGSILLVEQPEMHLHPRAQSELGDLLIEAVTARENAADRNIQLIVESHSEHLLRRIQRRVAEGGIAPEKVALYFCQPGSSGSVIQRLELDEYGDILNWPEEFFGDELGDLLIQTREGMQRKLRTE